MPKIIGADSKTIEPMHEVHKLQQKDVKLFNLNY